MARPPLLVSEFTAAVRLAMFWPSTGGPVTDADILTVANRINDSEVWPKVNEGRGKVLTTVWDIPMHAGSTFDEPSGYPIPSESLAVIDGVSYVAPNGTVEPLEQVTEHELRAYLLGPSSSSSGEPRYFALRGGQVHVFPHPTTLQTGQRIRLHIVARPLKMAQNTAPVLYAELASDPALASGKVRLSLVAGHGLSSSWGTDPSTYDLMALSASPPHVPTDFYAAAQAEIVSASDYIDVETANWTRGSELTAVPGRARVGDYVIANYQTPIVQLPSVAYKVLLDGVVAEFAESRGQHEKWRRRTKMFDDGLEALPGKLSPRVQGSPEVFVNHNSALRLEMSGSGGYARRR